jgi:hypothetical protein
MKLTIGQKSERVLRFLRGLRKPRVARAVAAYGFTQEDWDEGWRLLENAAGGWLTRERPLKVADPTVIGQLDAWENRWFPVAAATLRRRKPAMAEKVFRNLSQTSGVAVTVSVSTFIQRVRQLETDGPDGQEALAILRVRGLTDDVLEHADTLLKSFGDVKLMLTDIVPDPEEESERLKQAQHALWAWYLEWSTITRNSVKDRNLLRGLGFGTTGGDTSSEEEPGRNGTPAELPAVPVRKAITSAE